MRKALPLLAVLAMAGTAMAAETGRVERVGELATVRKQTPHPLPAVEAGRVAWQDTFTWPKASYIAVHFEKFDLAPGDSVVVSTPDGRFRYIFEGRGKPGSGGTFWATHVPGDTCVVTLHGGGSGGSFGYVVDKFAHGFPEPERLQQQAAGDTEAICGADNSQEAKCLLSPSPEIYQPSRAVARLLIQGTDLCTGWLVGCEGHVITNQHCIGGAAAAMDTDFEFMAEGATCGTNCQSQLGCPGTIVANTSTLVKVSAPMDFALVLLPTNPTATYGYLKMRASSAVVDERIYIPGHPGGFGKRISVSSDYPSDGSGFCEVATLTAPACAAGGPPDVSYGCDTQGGSSGSPVVAYSDHRVVALHHCNSGGGLCPNTGVPIQEIVTNLQSTNNLPACSVQQLAGTVELDYEDYLCNAVVGIKVKDDSIAGQGTQDVSIDSTTEGTPETVTLTETPAASGFFLGTISTTTAGPTPSDGVLSAPDGDTITVTYIDADDGSGGMMVPRTDTAIVDCNAPVISNVNASSITGNSAVINWTTDEPANSVVHYGLTPPGGNLASSSSLVTSHAQPLTGLQGCSTYYYWVVSQDPAGNVAQDDNGGSYYTFVTLANSTPSYPSGGAPVPIPDNNPTGATSTINVPDNNTVLDVDVKVNITHTFDADLLLTLVPPVGSPITLSNHRGGQFDHFINTVFDDEATTPIASGVAPFTGSFKPDGLLSAADGIAALGNWQLKVVDNANIDTGTINNWTLTLTFPPSSCGASLAYDSSSATESCSGGGTGGGNTVVEPGEDVDIPVTLRNNGTMTITGITASLSTSATGVTVTRSSASYPDMAVMTTASSYAPHFAFTVDSSVACGTLIPFTVTADGAQGTWMDSFSVRVGAPGSSTNTYNSTDVPKNVADNVTVESTLPIVNTSIVTDVNVKVHINHTWDADMNIVLVGPNGTPVDLSSGNGSSGDHYINTIFDDAAATSITSGAAPFTGTFRPEGPLSALNGIPANGTWKLRITDTATTDTGTLNAWSVTLTTASGFVCDSCAVSAPLTSPVDVVFPPGSKSSLEWTSIGGASFYRIYRGDCVSLVHVVDPSLDSCLEATVSSTATGSVLTVDPPVDCIDWYLVRSGNGGGLGPPGDATSGPRQHDSSGACP